jgi:hypothetical protein
MRAAHPRGDPNAADHNVGRVLAHASSVERATKVAACRGQQTGFRIAPS